MPACVYRNTNKKQQKDFDPKNLKVAQLRNLFVEYEIDYPSSAKKPELIEIFNRELKPKAADLLKQANSVTANDEGIIKVPKKSKDRSDVEEDVDMSDEVLEIKPKKKRSKQADGKVTKKKPSKKTEAATADGIEQLTTEKKEKRKLKKVEAPPTTTDEEGDTTEETHFSKRNVFQRASLSPQSKKNSPIRSKLELTLKPKDSSSDSYSDSDFYNEKTLSPNPKPVIPKKRLNHRAADDEDETEPEKKKPLKSPTPTKDSKFIQKKFEEGPDLFKVGKTPTKKKVQSKQKTSKKSSPQVAEESFQSVTNELFQSAEATADTIKFEDAITTPKSEVSKLKDFISVSPDFAKNLGKNFISSPFSNKNKTSSTPKGPKKALGYVDELKDEKIEMEIITPSIEDEEKELKRLQDEMSFHMVETEEKIDKVQDQLEVEEADEVVGDAVQNLFFKMISGIFFSSFIIISLIFTIWYLDQKQKIGFCGYEVYERTFKVENNEPFDFEGFLNEHFAPECSPCPQHGECNSYLQLSCDEDYLISYPFYSLGGLLPVAGDCVPDKIKQQRIDDMVNYSLEILRIRNAKNCGKESDEKVGLSTDEIHDILKGSQDDLLPAEKFEELWVKVLDDLQNEPEITLRFQESGNQQNQDTTNDKETKIYNTILRSSSKSKFSIKCKFQEVIYHQLIRFKYLIIGVLSLIILTIYGRWKFQQYFANKEKIDKFTTLIIKKLIQQNKIASRDNTGLTRDYLALVQLRDVLIDDADKNKLSIWNQIMKRVARNSNIEERTIEVGGEIIKIWKWIGVDIDEGEFDKK